LGTEHALPSSLPDKSHVETHLTIDDALEAVQDISSSLADKATTDTLNITGALRTGPIPNTLADTTQTETHVITGALATVHHFSSSLPDKTHAEANVLTDALGSVQPEVTVIEHISTEVKVPEAVATVEVVEEVKVSTGQDELTA
jgi:hypothetical protein